MEGGGEEGMREECLVKRDRGCGLGQEEGARYRCGVRRANEIGGVGSG